MSLATAFRVPEATRQEFRKELNETERADPDTDIACALLIQLYVDVSAAVKNKDLQLRPTIHVESVRTATLVVGMVPLLTRVTCSLVKKSRDAGTVRDIRCMFVDQIKEKEYKEGVLHIEFWRSSIDESDRTPVMYKEPDIVLDLAAQPDWVDLGIDDILFATDRANLLHVMKLVRNMHSIMPTGISTLVDFIYQADIQNDVGGKRKRNVTDDRVVAKHGVGNSAKDGIASSHIGYVVIFEHTLALPTISSSFMDYLVDKVGPTVLNWIVLFPIPNVRKVGALGVIVRRSNVADDIITPFTFIGTEWLSRRVTALPR